MYSCPTLFLREDNGREFVIEMLRQWYCHYTVKYYCLNSRNLKKLSTCETLVILFLLPDVKMMPYTDTSALMCGHGL